MWCWAAQKGVRGTWRASLGLEADKKNANCAQMMLSWDVALENQESQAQSSTVRRAREAAPCACRAGSGAGDVWGLQWDSRAGGNVELLLLAAPRASGCLKQMWKQFWAACWKQSSAVPAPFAHVVQWEFLLHQPRLLVLLPKAHSSTCRNLCAQGRAFGTNKKAVHSPKAFNLLSSSLLLLTSRL